MRKAHYWKAAGKASAPSEIIVFDCETWHGDLARTDDGEWQTLRLGVALAYRLDRGRRTRVRELVFTHPDDFWALVRERLNHQRPVWVFGHNLPYDLGIVSGWGFIMGGDYLTEKVAVSASMFFIKGELDGCGLNFCDTINYYHCSLNTLGKSVGILKGAMPEQSAPDGDWVEYCRQDVLVTAAGVDSLIGFIRDEHLGPWQPSIASLAFSAYRSRFMRERTLVHTDPGALSLERGSYYGGIVETAFLGRVPATPVFELDVCSMFPAVAQMDLPTRLANYSERVGRRRLETLMSEYSVIAEVDIESPDTQYPCRLKAGTYNPVGRFRTTLAHPELEVALRRGHIGYVHRAAWYHRAPIFGEYMRYFTRRKGEYRQQDKQAFATLCKYYANSLYGKTGQLSPVWWEWGKDALQHIEQDAGVPAGTLAYWYDRPPVFDTLEHHHRFREIDSVYDTRCYYGVVEIRVGQVEARDSCPAIAATITSSARVMLREFHRVAGRGNWYYSDTDSVWTNLTGYRQLEAHGMVQPETLGKLKLEREHGFMTIHGPKDYETDRVCRIKGIRASAVKAADGGYYQLQFPGAKEQIASGLSGGVMVKTIKKRLHRRITKCVQLRDGWTRPLRFPDECPERVRAGFR